MRKSVVMPLLLNADWIIVTICILLLIGLLFYCFNDTGYYVRHNSRSNWIGVCHRDYGAWFYRTPKGASVPLYKMGSTNFERYCDKQGIARYLEILKAQVQ